MTTTFLTTGAVAEILGVSRQHVADLCDRGDLSCVLVGTHRRIPSSELDRVIGRLTREQERSLWLHRAVLGELSADPDGVIATARDNIQRWLEVHRPDGRTREHLDRWSRLLDAGPDRVAAVLVDPSQVASDLRQTSPFAGVLTDDRRAQVLSAFRRHWELDH